MRRQECRQPCISEAQSGFFAETHSTDCLSVSDAQQQTGLRLMLNRSVPGPWSEAAKAVLDLRHVAYQAVEQQGGHQDI